MSESGLPNETNAMFTNIEGDWDEVMAVIKSCVLKVAETAPRVSVVIKLDHRPGAVDSLTHKVDAVEVTLLGRWFAGGDHRRRFRRLAPPWFCPIRSGR